MKLRTKISPEVFPFSIQYEDPILFVGSCFSIEIGQKLQKLGYKVFSNPFGITFNSASISSCIRACATSNSLLQDEVFFHNALWAHSDFHTSFSHPYKSVTQNRIKNSISSTYEYLESVKIVAITLGTAFVYEDVKCRQIVNNCHKRPGSDFSRRLLSSDEIVGHLNNVKSRVDALSDKEVQYIITVSPVRHTKDGIVQNQRSKSTCISAAHDFCDIHDDAFYFPSYEVMMDDLRDYRFYNADLIHPSSMAVDYIYDLFEQTCLDDNEKSIREEVAKIQQARQHKPLFPDSDNHKKFENDLKRRIERLKEKHEGIDFPF